MNGGKRTAAVKIGLAAMTRQNIGCWLCGGRLEYVYHCWWQCRTCRRWTEVEGKANNA